MNRCLEFKNFTPSPRSRELVESLIARLERHAATFSADTAFLRLFVRENAARHLYHATLTCGVTGRTLAAQEERHDAEETIREAFAEVERQLEKHKEMLSQSHLYKSPARREAARREKAEAFPAEERERELFHALVERRLKQLYNFVRREIGYYVATGDLLPGKLMAEGVVDATLLRAYREFVKAPIEREISSWLIGLGAEQLEVEVKRLKTERTLGVHIEEDIPKTPPAQEVSTLGDEALDFYQPDEDRKLEDIIPDMTAPTPERILESRELRRYINRTLASLPRLWRQAFVFHYVESVPPAEIARMNGHTEWEVERHLEYAREYLSQRLNEAGFNASPHDETTPAIFGTAANVEVPAVFRNAVIEKYRKLEESGEEPGNE